MFSTISTKSDWPPPAGVLAIALNFVTLSPHPILLLKNPVLALPVAIRFESAHRFVLFLNGFALPTLHVDLGTFRFLFFFLLARFIRIVWVVGIFTLIIRVAFTLSSCYWQHDSLFSILNDLVAVPCHQEQEKLFCFFTVGEINDQTPCKPVFEGGIRYHLGLFWWTRIELKRTTRSFDQNCI